MLFPSLLLLPLVSQMLSPPDDHIFKDSLQTDTTVNSVFELSPVITLIDLADVIPEEDVYRAMPNSLRHVLMPPTLDPSSRPRSILLDPSPYSRPRWSPSSEGSAASRARQSVSSIGSYSTIHIRSAPPIKSILTRHDSGIFMATITTRRKRRSPPSVKFVDAPTVHYDNAVYHNSPPPRSPPFPSERQKSLHWFAKWWKKSPSPPPRPSISGPYHLSYAASLVDVHSYRPSKPKPGRLKRLWQRLTSMIG